MGFPFLSKSSAIIIIHRIMEKVEVNSERWFSLENFENERWENIKGSNHSVSTCGRVRRDAHSTKQFINGIYAKTLTYKARIMRLTLSPLGYYHTRISINGTLTDVRINRLVAEAFIPNPDNLPHVNHKNEDTTDNRMENLEWCTPEYNNNYGTARKRLIATRIKKDSEKWRTIKQFSLDGRLIRSFKYKSLLEKAGFDYYAIDKCCHHIVPSAFGYIWRYNDDPFSSDFKVRTIDDRNELGQVAPTPVIQYDLNGNPIKEYPSMTEAAIAMNGNTTTIGLCCNGRNQRAYDYMWRRKGEPAPQPYKNRNKRPVIQLTLDGQLVREYSSLMEASEIFNGDKKKWTSIWDCCAGKAKTYKGFIWKYKTE